MIALLNEYKAYRPASPSDIDNYLADVYAIYPGLDIEGKTPNHSAINDVIAIRDAYIANGRPFVEALQMAVNEVAIKRKWIYPQDSLR
ncbi:hypothetical protein D3C78_1481560 [compost metagenome]